MNTDENRSVNGPQLSRERFPVPHGRSPLRHILLAQPQVVQNAITRLHQLGYAAPYEWTRLATPSEGQLVLIVEPGDVYSLLVRSVENRPIE